MVLTNTFVCGILSLHWRRLDGWHRRLHAVGARESGGVSRFEHGTAADTAARGSPRQRGIGSMSCARKGVVKFTRCWEDGSSFFSRLTRSLAAQNSWGGGQSSPHSRLKRCVGCLHLPSPFHGANPLAHVLGAKPITRHARHSSAHLSAPHQLSFSFPSSPAPGAIGITSGRGESSPDLHLVHHANPVHEKAMDRIYMMNKMVSRKLEAWQRKHAR